MPLAVLCAMAICFCNVTGDAVISSIVAKKNNMMDVDIFNRN